MIIAQDIVTIRRRRAQRREKSWGFVPTMGCLHEGHLSLISRAISENDISVVSIFINPMQFNDQADYHSYPQDLNSDLKRLEKTGVDVAFTPQKKMMFPDGFSTKITTSGLSDTLEGASRPGHFDGVCTIVAKLFHVVQPTRAYFGEKDAQQLLIIKKLVADLNFDTEIIGCPTCREDDGLAMSSRNARLAFEERMAAPILFRSLMNAKEMILNGEKDSEKIVRAITTMIEGESLAKIDLLSINDADTLAPMSVLNGNILISLAVFFGTVRLIDNIRIVV